MLVPSEALKHSGKRLKVELHNSIREETRLFPGVPFRYINNVRLYHKGLRLPFQLNRMESSDGVVIAEPMLATNAPETKDVLVFVQNLESLRATGSRQPRNEPNFPGASDLAITAHGAAPDEAFIGLGVIEAADDGPDGIDGGRDMLGDEGAALIISDVVGVVTPDEVMEVGREGGSHEAGMWRNFESKGGKHEEKKSESKERKRMKLKLRQKHWL